MNTELILSSVSKPTRYLGNELNCVKKRPQANLIRVALAFPDIYEVGMSHLGLRILYHILNSMDDVWAERVYAPWIDMESVMRARSIPLFSLESSTPLRDFDIIGFSLQYEMSYTNVLNMLELAQIPLLAKDRDRTHPLIIAGGPCAFNPEPIADFIDLFAIGDGEEIIKEIVDCYRTYRHKDRRELLSKMAQIEGVYVPSFADLDVGPDGMLVVSGGMKIRKRIVSDLDNVPYPKDYIVPFQSIIHDRAVVEIMRGCLRGCRFCQAGMIYRPLRERSKILIEHLSDEIIKRTGYEEISLSSLSSCDYSSIGPIVEHLNHLLSAKGVSISLPSLRMDAFSLELAKELGVAGKAGLTFAPEVAEERLARCINKYIPHDQVLSTIESAFSSGWDSVKLYFMIGLPTETEDDVLKIAHLVKECLSRANSANKKAKLSISVSTFVPKAHTPFQWERQLPLDEVHRRQKLLISNISSKKVQLRFHSPQISYLEGVFARGDRRLCQVLQTAHSLGCRLDGWSEIFNFKSWMQAFAKCGIDPDLYHRARANENPLPWDHIDTCVTKDFLLSELNRAYNFQLTPDCRSYKCGMCGVCSEEIRVRLSVTDAQEQEIAKEKTPQKDKWNVCPTKSVCRIRFQFAKRDELKFISHLDLIDAILRTFRRAEIPMAYSAGFSPHPKISFGSALPVGTTSEAEFADIDLSVPMEPEDFVQRANSQMPLGLEILKAQEIPLNSASLMTQINLASYTVRIRGENEFNLSDPDSEALHLMSLRDPLWVKRPQRTRNDEEVSFNLVDIRPYIKSVRIIKHINKALELEMMLRQSGSNRAKPEEVVCLILKKTCIEEIGKEFYLEIHKTGSYIEWGEELLSPFEKA